GILFLSVLAFQTVAYQFSPLYHEPFNPDLTMYINVGRGWIKGIIPYVDVLDAKGPALFEIFAFLAWAKWDHYLGVFVLCFLINSLSAVYIYKMCCLWYAKVVALVISVLALAVMFNIFTGQASLCTEVFLLPLFALPAYYLIESFISNYPISGWNAVAIGGILCILFWAKISLIIPLLIPFAWWMLILNRKIAETKHCITLRLIQVIISFIVGSLLVWTPLLLSRNFVGMLNVYLGGVASNHSLGFSWRQLVWTTSIYNLPGSGHSFAPIIWLFCWLCFVLLIVSKRISFQIKTMVVVSYFLSALLCNFYTYGATTLTFQFQIIYFVIFGLADVSYWLSMKRVTQMIGILTFFLVNLMFVLHTYNRITLNYAVRADKSIEIHTDKVGDYEVTFANTTIGYYYCNLSKHYFSSDFYSWGNFVASNQIAYYCCENRDAYVLGTNVFYAWAHQDESLKETLDNSTRKNVLENKYRYVMIYLSDISNVEEDLNFKFLKNLGYEMVEIFNSSFAAPDRSFAVLFELPPA
ncbi:MAG: glycosyltransferase family 39 protein, partial [Bifidobacteriaceae bacterium]|nr:glycosyltransferase family 39 protein [Bifidobacteriaceae bacterium]